MTVSGPRTHREAPRVPRRQAVVTAREQSEALMTECDVGQVASRRSGGRDSRARRCRHCGCVAADIEKSNGLRTRQRPGDRYHQMRLSRPFSWPVCAFGRVWAQGREALSIAAGHRPGAHSVQDCQSVQIYAYELFPRQCPRQDSNLRSRLRRALLCTALTWPSVLNETPWGAYGARNAGLKGDATLAQ
jgi:hypothetical protein